MTTRSTAATGAGPTGTADGRRVRLYVVRDQGGSADAADWSLIATLSATLERSAPELSFEVIEAPGAVADWSASGFAGVRDFRLAAALGPTRPSRRDVIAVHARQAGGSIVLRLRPARPASLADPRAPAIEGLCSVSDPPSPHDLDLIAVAALALAVTAEPEGDARRKAALAALVERMALPLMRQARADAIGKHPVAGTEQSVLAAWALAWVGVARGDTEALDLARTALDGLICNPRLDLTTRELAQLNANLAAVCLALATTREGARRLSEGLAACRSALHLIDPAVEPAMLDALTGLRGELAAALGLLTGNRQRLVEAADALAIALDRPSGAGDELRRRDLLDRVRALNGTAPTD